MDGEKNVTIIRKKKKVAGHGGHHGGAWKVAYADFVTAMMAFFMVMWLMGADEETKQAVEDYFNGKTISRDGQGNAGSMGGGDASHRSAGSQGRFEEKSLERPDYAAPVYVEEYAILKDLSSFYEGSAFTRDVEADSVKYNIIPRLNFEPGSVAVPDSIEARTLLTRLIGIFKQHDGVIMIEGYPDDAQDWSLAYGRSISVRRALINSGVNPEKLIPSAGHKLTTEGKLGKVELGDSGSVRFILKRQRNHE